MTLLNRGVNWGLNKLGKERFSISKRMKNGLESAKKYVDDFEKSVVDIALENGHNFVVCGHIHQPKKEIHLTKKGRCTYLNSGDWVENLTALEYSFKRWKIYRYNHDKLSPFFVDEELKEMDIHELVASITAKKEQEKKEMQEKGKKKQKGDKESID